MAESTENPLFSLVHGRFHGSWHWQFVQQELRQQGWESIAPNLSIEDPRLRLDDHAEQLDEEEKATGAAEVIRVGWSWGANVILRSLSAAPFKKRLIFVAGAFHTSSIPGLPDDMAEITEHSAQYDIIRRNPENLRGMAGDTFYHDVADPKIKERAIAELRDHPRRDSEPPLLRLPDIPMDYIRTTRDYTITYASQTIMAQLMTIPRPFNLESGHAPMLSQPQKLAAMLISLAQ